MNRRRIGRTGVHVTELGFGSAPIGNLHAAVDDEQAQATVDAAWQAGVRYFDTAPHYGLGLAERRLGRALASRPRAEYVISTKVGRLLVPNDDPRGTDLDSGFAVPDTLRRRPEVASVVAGMASPDQVRLAVRRVGQPIPDALWPRMRPTAPLPDGAFSRPPSP